MQKLKGLYPARATKTSFVFNLKLRLLGHSFLHKKIYKNIEIKFGTLVSWIIKTKKRVTFQGEKR